MDKLSKGEQMVGGGSALLLIMSFFSLWWKFEGGGITVRGNGWDSGLSALVKLALVLAIVALVLVGLKASGTSITLPVTWGLAYVGLGALITLFLLLAVLLGPEDDGAGFLGHEVSRGMFLLISPLVGAVIALGGYMHMQGETTAGPAATGPATPPAV